MKKMSVSGTMGLYSSFRQWHDAVKLPRHKDILCDIWSTFNYSLATPAKNFQNMISQIKTCAK